MAVPPDGALEDGKVRNLVRRSILVMCLVATAWLVKFTTDQTRNELTLTNRLPVNVQIRSIVITPKASKGAKPTKRRNQILSSPNEK